MHRTLLEHLVRWPKAYDMFEVIRFLCDAGAELGHECEPGYGEPPRWQTAPVCAVRGGNQDIVKFLLDCGAVIRYETLQATDGDPDMLSLLHLHKRLREDKAENGNPTCDLYVCQVATEV